MIKPPINNSQTWNPRMFRDTLCKNKKKEKRNTSGINSVMHLGLKAEVHCKSTSKMEEGNFNLE